MPAGEVQVRPATERDAREWQRMRVALWPEASETEHAEEIQRFLDGPAGGRPAAVLIAEVDGVVVGFVELAIRPYAEGCVSDRVAYLEGWYVDPRSRRRGVGGALVRGAAAWGRAQGCTEFASDARPDNDVSLAAHRAVGFTDVGAIRCFRKGL